jgi:hypothetical protein
MDEAPSNGREPISLADFAKELRLDVSNALKAIKKLQKSTGRIFMQPGRVRGNQRGMVLTRAAADEVLELRKQQGYTVDNRSGIVNAPSGQPTVYVVGLPGGRIKIGFTDSFEQRLADHRTIAPDLEVLRHWKLPQAYEVVMIDLARNKADLRAIGGEVFEAGEEARETLLTRLDALARDVGADRPTSDGEDPDSVGTEAL